MGHKTTIAAAWPTYDEAALKQDVVRMVVQINGKVRAQFDVAPNLSEDQLKKIILADPAVQKYTDGKTIQKFIVVANKLVSVVV